MKYTAELARPPVGERISALREEALAAGIPVADKETLHFLLTLLSALRPARILEIGTAVGLSAAAMLECCPEAQVTTIESDEDLWRQAKENLSSLGLSGRAVCHLGDAGEILTMMDGPFDFIFLDGPKAQYIHYLPDLKRLLAPRGVLFADDVLLYGWVSGRAETPYKRRSIFQRLREYLGAVCTDPDLRTVVLEVGEGAAISVKTQ